MGSARRGFTLVELLIVVVVIAILAAISVVAYNGIQERARDSQRSSDMANLAKALEMYYLDHGQFPRINGGATEIINSSWATTADDSWQLLLDKLEPYAKGIGWDPISTPGVNVQGSGYNYAYFSNNIGIYCGTGENQTYIILYRHETKPRETTGIGDCTQDPLSYGNVSYYRVAK